MKTTRLSTVCGHRLRARSKIGLVSVSQRWATGAGISPNPRLWTGPRRPRNNPHRADIFTDLLTPDIFTDHIHPLPGHSNSKIILALGLTPDSSGFELPWPLPPSSESTPGHRRRRNSRSDIYARAAACSTCETLDGCATPSEAPHILGLVRGLKAGAG